MTSTTKIRPLRILTLATLCLFVLMPATSLPHFTDDVPDDQLIESLISAMTEEELLGQVFFLVEPAER